MGRHGEKMAGPLCGNRNAGKERFFRWSSFVGGSVGSWVVGRGSRPVRIRALLTLLQQHVDHVSDHIGLITFDHEISGFVCFSSFGWNIRGRGAVI
jgi:hypothetical protein